VKAERVVWLLCIGKHPSDVYLWGYECVGGTVPRTGTLTPSESSYNTQFLQYKFNGEFLKMYSSLKWLILK
jgi:hypothetical protein